MFRKSKDKGQSWKGGPAFKGDANDLVIPIMGPTGVGKSTFLKALTGDESVIIGHDLDSCTTGMHPVAVTIPKIYGAFQGQRLILVDTPGFDDSAVSDSEILRRIAVWLAQSYDQHMKLAGVVYLHSISEGRMRRSFQTSLNVFEELCGPKALDRVVLGTTKWDELGNPSMGETREKQLKEKWLSRFLDANSMLMRVSYPTSQSEDQTARREAAWRIIEPIITGVNGRQLEALRIQKELVDLKKKIPRTEAGKKLRFSLKEFKRSLEEEMKAAQPNSDDARLYDMQAQMRKIQEQVKDLKIRLPFVEQVTSFLGISRSQ